MLETAPADGPLLPAVRGGAGAPAGTAAACGAPAGAEAWPGGVGPPRVERSCVSGDRGGRDGVRVLLRCTQFTPTREGAGDRAADTPLRRFRTPGHGDVGRFVVPLFRTLLVAGGADRHPAGRRPRPGPAGGDRPVAGDPSAECGGARRDPHRTLRHQLELPGGRPANGPLESVGRPAPFRLKGPVPSLFARRPPLPLRPPASLRPGVALRPAGIRFAGDGGQALIALTVQQTV